MSHHKSHEEEKPVSYKDLFVGGMKHAVGQIGKPSSGHSHEYTNKDLMEAHGHTHHGTTGYVEPKEYRTGYSEPKEYRTGYSQGYTTGHGKEYIAEGALPHHIHTSSIDKAGERVTIREGTTQCEPPLREGVRGFHSDTDREHAILVCQGDPTISRDLNAKGDHRCPTDFSLARDANPSATHHQDVVYKEGKRQYTREDGAVVYEHVYPIHHTTEKLPVMEETARDVVVRQNVIPREVTEVHRHIHPIEKEVVKEYIHPKEVTEVHEKVHELVTKEVHEHIHPVIEKEVRKDVYLPEKRHVEQKHIDRGEVAREQVDGVLFKGVRDPNAKVFEHMHKTEHKSERVPIMQAPKREVEVKREVVPEERLEIHRHVHPIEKDVIQEHVHPKEVTEVVENVHETKVVEVHEHVRPEEYREVRKDTYLPEKRHVEERYVDHGEVARERVDLDYGVQKGVLLHDAGTHMHSHETTGSKSIPSSTSKSIPSSTSKSIPSSTVKPFEKPLSKEKGLKKKKTPKKTSKTGAKTFDIDVDFDVDKHGKVSGEKVRTSLDPPHTKGSNVDVDLFVKSEEKAALGGKKSKKHTGHS